MRKPKPWGAGTSGNDVREAARDAARREGISLNEWLAQAVGQYAAEAGIDPADMDEDDRLDAVAARLRGLGVRDLRQSRREFAANQLPSSPRPQDRPARNAKLRLPRVAPWSSGATALRRNEAEADYEDAEGLLDRAANRLESETDVEKLAHRIEHLETERLDPINDTLARIEARLQSLGMVGAAAASPLRVHAGAATRPSSSSDQLGRVESKVNALLTSVSSPTATPSQAQCARAAAEPGFKTSSLAAAIAEISRRQQALEAAGGAPRQAQDQRQLAPRLVRSSPEPGPAESDGAALASLRGDIASLAGKVDEMRREQAARNAPPPVCNLDKLRAEIASMSDALHDLGSRGSLAPLEAAVRNLTQQIENSRTDGIREAVLRPLDRLVGDLRHAIAEIDPRTTIRGLESEVQKLGSKLDNLGKCGFDAKALGAIDDRTREIRDLLAAPPTQAPIEKLERQMAALAERMDQMHSPARPSEGDLDAVAEELRALMREPAPSTLAKIESQLDAIAGKVEEAIAEARDESRYTALANRINDVHAELAESIANGAPQLDQNALETLIRELAERLEQARAPQADNQAIEALQRQVSEFAARLDQANVGAASLTSLERSIGDLFAELERTREASYRAAETAARNVLREALAQTTGAADNADLARDLVELRNMQDEAGRRTLATLNAVHETLEKVVDRLATVESDIADVRAQKPAELLASGPAPNFAPAVGREPVVAGPKEPPPFVAPVEPPAVRAEPRPQSPRAPAVAPKAEPADDALEDFLIEPGRGFPGRRDPLRNDGVERKPAASGAFDTSEAATGRAGFIAAARRAAQAAQMESAAALGGAPQRGGMAEDGEASTSVVEQTRNFITQHKRPVVLSVAALFLALGAYAVVKTASHAPLTIDLPVHGGKEAPVPHGKPMRPSEQSRRLDTKPRAAATPSPAGSSPSATNSSAGARGTPGATSSIDPIVTGTIGKRPVAQPAPPSPAVLQSLAQAGDAKAQYELASLYATGHGMPHDLKLAAHWYEKASAQGLAPAEYRLGAFYEKGLGVERNLTRAMAWYRKAAEAGNVRAMHNLAVLTAEGGESGKPDYAVAARWFRKAAEFGVHDSQYNLAILLARGLGVPQNLTLSYVWFAVAAAQGDEDAGKKRDDVGARLNAADLAAAKATAKAFHPKKPDPAANEVAPPPGGWVAPAAQSHRISRAKLSEL